MKTVNMGIPVFGLGIRNIMNIVTAKDVALSMKVDAVCIHPGWRVGNGGNVLHGCTDVVVLHGVVPATDIDPNLTHVGDFIFLNYVMRGLSGIGYSGIENDPTPLKIVDIVIFDIVIAPSNLDAVAGISQQIIGDFKAIDGYIASINCESFCNHFTVRLIGDGSR